jgi:hypothetical protein
MGLYSKVRSACADKGTTVFALEQQLGFPRSSIAKWDAHTPSFEKVSAVAKALDKPLEYFAESDSKEN